MSGPLIQNVRAPRVRPVPVKTLYVRPGGNDSARGDQAAPLATILAALDRIPTVIDDARWRIDVTGLSDVGGARWFFPPKLSGIPADVQLSGGLFTQDLSVAPVTIIAVPSVFATLTVTGQVADPVTTLVTISTSNSFTANQLRGKFVRGSVRGEFGVVASNTAGPNSSVYVTMYGPGLTAPVEVLDPSCTLTLGDVNETFNYSNLLDTPCAVALTGLKIQKANAPLGAALSTKHAQIFFQFCDVEGVYAETGEPIRFDGCYLHDGLLSLNGASHSVYQSYMRRVDTQFHGDGNHGAHGYFWTVAEECGPLGHWNNFQSAGGFDVGETEVINPKVGGSGAGAATQGVYYRGGAHARVRNAKISGATQAMFCEGPGYLYCSTVQGSGNTDVGCELQDGAQVKKAGTTTVTGANGDLRVGALGIRTWAGTPHTDPTQLCRVS